MTSFLAILLLSAMGAAGDTLIKLAGEHSPVNPIWLALGTVVYVLTIPGWFFVIRQVPLASVGALYASTTVFILLAVGVIGFRERLTIVELAGILCIVVGVIALRRLL